MERIRLERKTEYRNVARFTCDNCGGLIAEIVCDKWGKLDKSKLDTFTIYDRRTITMIDSIMMKTEGCHNMYPYTFDAEYSYKRHYCSICCRNKLQKPVHIIEANFDKYENYMAESKKHDPYNVIAEKDIEYGKKLKPILEDCGYVKVE